MWVCGPSLDQKGEESKKRPLDFAVSFSKRSTCCITHLNCKPQVQIPSRYKDTVYKCSFLQRSSLSLRQVGEYFLAYPHDVLTIFDEVLRESGAEASQSDGAVGAKRDTRRHTLHARITGQRWCCSPGRKDPFPASQCNCVLLVCMLYSLLV